MIFTSKDIIRTFVALMTAMGIIAFSGVPANAHATRHHHHHGKHVNVRVNIGGGYVRPHYYYAPAPVVYVAPPKRSCTRVRRDGWYRGHPALVSNRVCFNVYGEAFVQPDTKRLVHYY